MQSECLIKPVFFLALCYGVDDPFSSMVYEENYPLKSGEVGGLFRGLP
jgi:hypothetical protein